MWSLNCISIYNVNNRPRQENLSAYHTKSIRCFNPIIPDIARLSFYEVLNSICSVNSGNNSQLFKLSLFRTDGSFNFILGILFSLNAAGTTYQ